MIDEVYFNKLSQYVGRDIKWIVRNDEIKVICDVDYSLSIKRNGALYFMYLNHHGQIELLSEYNENDLKFHMAQFIKNAYTGDIDYSPSSKFENLKNVNDVEKLLLTYCNLDFYSIDNAQVFKINLISEKDGRYSIFFMDLDGNKHYIEKYGISSFVFPRFYNEIAYFAGSIKQIKEYAKIFNENLTSKENMQRIIYGY
ncbi:MAG TPA: hypothetical protein GX401_05380 [Clostridiales bacterium]|nr:hypothetical protein [Clostridiales bacterium]